MRRSRQTSDGAPGGRSGRGRLRLDVLLLTGVLVVVATARAESDPEEASVDPLVVPVVPGAAPGNGAPGLDALLSVPKDYLEPRGRTIAGAGEDEWRRRFAQAHRRLQGAQTALDETKGALDEAAEGSGSSQWAVAPPGAGGGGSNPTDSPLSFKLRQDLVRNRERLEDAERALRDLRIEADLAGVPPDWRDDRQVPLGKRLPDSPYYN